MRVLGLISGTSHDGIDSAVVDFEGIDSSSEGAEITATVRQHGAAPYDATLRARIVAALPPAETTFAEVAKLDTEIGQAFAAAAVDAIAEAGPVDLIVSHGQTVFHWVEGSQVHGTLQIGQPAWIAERTGAPVLSDIRIRDIVAGGQGAPLASTIDALLLAGRGNAAAPNLGGISNVTVVSDTTRAWDIGPANALIDAVIVDRDLHPAGYDEGGRIAASGTVDEDLLAVLLDEPYYRLASPKTTGKELFHLPYVRHAVGERTISDADLVATLTELTVRTVADALRPEDLSELFVSGGGVHNDVVMRGLAAALPQTRVRRTDELGIGADEKEAVLMALLGYLSWHGAPGTVPSATGARAARVLGTVTPGATPLQLPAPTAAPTSLRMRTEERP